MNVRRMARLCALVVVVGLGGCGGGGGGGSPGPAGSVSGTVSYDDVPNVNGGLAYNAIVSKPVRGAGVDIVDASSGAVLASTETDDNGNYSVQMPGQALVTVRVRAQLARSAARGASWDVAVRDNTQGNALYSMESPSFAPSGNTTRDLHAPSGWDGSGYSGARVAGPFAILDTVYTAMNKVLSVAPSTSFPSLRLYWSPRNVPARGQVSLGQIGTTSFVASTSGAVIYVLGAEGVDTDEFDASVIAHEWGHYYQNAFSRDDSPGGSHDLDELIDQRLAFSEGWGNAWSGIALARQNYTDSQGPGQGAGVNMDLAATPSGRAGWYREASVQSILWNLNNRFGYGGIHAAMTGGLRSTPALTTIHAFAAAYAGAQPQHQGDLSSLLVGQAISGAFDPWGALEGNNGATPLSLPLYHLMTGPSATVCVTNQNDPDGEGNKLGSFSFLRVTVPNAGSHQISVSGPPGSDPDFYVFAGNRLAASEGVGTSEVASVGLPAGEVVLAVNDANNTSSNTCLDVSIN
ncbi:hypothetical protein [Variovorax sp. OV329]|uniref:hypothetical protein n=1 Tax=Variovorax sp. OV329 TaxID=1882825 RepID=UPI0008F09E96|nr:hypothetical protein [Variovorax sp. OV329]SFM96288.1 hypothetical protein SAMN05444747_1123 [Variovorax sp. OV329]